MHTGDHISTVSEWSLELCLSSLDRLKSHVSMRRSLVSTSVWFFFHAVSVFSCWLRRMLFSAGFLFALRVSRDGSVPFGVQ